MKTWAVLASGPSATLEQAHALRAAKVPTVAVSDGFYLAPWCVAAVSADRAWWKHHTLAASSSCQKFCIQDTQGLEGIQQFKSMPSGVNSGLLGLAVAVHLGATRVLLLGIDLKQPGLHFFGRHPENFRPPKPQRLEIFKQQFRAYHPKGVEIINCAPGSALDAYPRGQLADCLAQLATQPA